MAICPPGAPDWRSRPRAPKQGYVLFFSTLEPRKNVGALLDAYERLIASGASLPQLVLAGKATAEAQPWLDRISGGPLSAAVRHVGYVEPDRRRELYEGARFLVQPSLDEGFGMTVLEAMSLGVPVIAANRGSLPEVLGGAGLLIDPEQPAAIAHAITRLLVDDGLAEACAEKGMDRARTFNWAETANRVYDTYTKAIERRRARGARRI
jgi:glycosyltransferase involved in cell wall biosynthesis